MYQLVKHHCVTKLDPYTQGMLETRTFLYSCVNMWTSKASSAWLNPYKIYFHLFLKKNLNKKGGDSLKFNVPSRNVGYIAVHAL